MLIGPNAPLVVERGIYLFLLVYWSGNIIHFKSCLYILFHFISHRAVSSEFFPSSIWHITIFLDSIYINLFIRLNKFH